MTLLFLFDKILIQILLLKRLSGDFLEHYFTNNTNLKSEIRTLSYTLKDHEFTFLSDNGVFSKDKIDFGSRLLVETILKNITVPPKTLLDVGCGYGFLGITLTHFWKCQSTLSDINKRALHLAEMNKDKNKVSIKTVESTCYRQIDEKYDFIVTNPPIRAGKKVVLEILLEAKNHLNEHGSLWFVIRKDQGAKSLIKEIEKVASCEIVEKSKGFFIMRAEFS